LPLLIYSLLDTNDATFRRKGNKDHVGYNYTVTETCGSENSVQFVTDYTVDKNVKTDPGTLEERLPMIKEKTGLTDLYRNAQVFKIRKYLKIKGRTMRIRLVPERQPAPPDLSLAGRPKRGPLK